jgi:hypothetical protein
MRGSTGRRLPWLVGALLVAAATAVAAAVPGGACDRTGTTVTLTSSANPVGYGEQLILTATVIPSSGTAVPSGSVTFSAAGAGLGTVDLGPAAQASLAVSALPAGSDQIVAAYSGSSSFSASSSPCLAQTVTVQGSTTVLLPTVNPATYGQTLLFVVSVTPLVGTGMPTGTVSLASGGSQIGSATLAGGTAAVVAASLGVGSHVVTAWYAGDGNFSASGSAGVTEQIEPASTATVLGVSPTAPSAGQTVTLTASVSSPAAEPNGTVTFYDGGSSLGSSGLSEGTATLLTCFQKGTQTLTAAYAGTADFTASTSAVVSLPVSGGSGCGCPHTTAAVSRLAGGVILTAFTPEGSTPAPPQLITVGATPGTVDEGQSVTLTSVVFGNSGAAFPSGTVDFVQGSTLLGSAPTAQVGTTNDALASLRIVLSPGSYPSITAVYHPNSAAQAWYTSATSSSSAALTVERVAAATTLDLATSLNPSSKGQPVIVTATVNHPSSSLTPTGTVSFTVNGAAPVVVSLDSLGQASMTLSTATTGTKTISATYAGDGNFAGSTGSTVESVVSSTGPTPTPTSTPAPTPSPTASSTPSATPRPTGSATPTPVPTSPSASPRTAASSTARAATVVVSPGSATTGNLPSGASGSTPLNPDQFDTSAVPPIDLISLVSGIQMGNAPQIIVFLLVGNALLIGAIAVTSRRGRRLTRRTLEAAGSPSDPLR